MFRKLLDTARTGQNCVPKVAGHGQNRSKLCSESCWTRPEQVKIVFRKLLDNGQNRSKLTILKGSKDGFSYFSLISIILFSNQGHPCICVLGVFATVYDFLIRVIPVYVLGVFATVYDFLIRVIPVYVC